MIERNLFMVWVGDQIPEYADFSFNSFQDANPSFNCEFISFPFDYAPHEIKELKEFSTFVNDEKKNLNQKCMIVSIITKYHMIQKYGGIYVDCDMFPIRQFDNLLLNRTAFKMSKVKPNQIHITDDCGFMGCAKGFTNWSNYHLLYPMSLYDYSDSHYVELKKKFMMKQPKFGEHYNDNKYCYVDHYDGNVLNKFTGEKN